MQVICSYRSGDILYFITVNTWHEKTKTNIIGSFVCAADFHCVQCYIGWHFPSLGWTHTIVYIKSIPNTQDTPSYCWKYSLEHQTCINLQFKTCPQQITLLHMFWVVFAKSYSDQLLFKHENICLWHVLIIYIVGRNKCIWRATDRLWKSDSTEIWDLLTG